MIYCCFIYIDGYRIRRRPFSVVGEGLCVRGVGPSWIIDYIELWFAGIS